MPSARRIVRRQCATLFAWRLRKGAVLGSNRARTKGPAIVTRSVNRVAPKVSPKMVGSLLRGNVRGPHRKYFRWGKLGGNPKEGGKQHLNVRRTVPYSEWGRRPEWGSPQNACMLWGSREGGGTTLPCQGTRNAKKSPPRTEGFCGKSNVMRAPLFSSSGQM